MDRMLSINFVSQKKSFHCALKLFAFYFLIVTVCLVISEDCLGNWNKYWVAVPSAVRYLHTFPCPPSIYLEKRLIDFLFDVGKEVACQCPSYVFGPVLSGIYVHRPIVFFFFVFWNELSDLKLVSISNDKHWCGKKFQKIKKNSKQCCFHV